MNMMAHRTSSGWKTHLGTVVAIGLVAGFLAFTVASAGGFRRGGEFDYYNLLIDGWRSGRLSMTIPPDPRLVALPDPYDPAQNRNFRLADASYYQGRYYLYFGPAPAAVLMLPFRVLTGQAMPQGAAVFVFCLIGIGAASVLWLGIRRRYFPESAWWTAGLGVLLLGFGTHVLALARRPQMWELPIAASYAFTMLALLAASRTVHGRHPVTALGSAGLALGLALASRPTALLATVLLIPPLWYLRRTRGAWLAGGVAAAVPLGVIAMALLWHNHARFGSMWEFGQRYQLTSLNETATRHFSLDYVWHNLRLYFFWPVRWTADFPFISARPLPSAPSGYYAGEEVYWLAVLFPVLWLAPAGLLAWMCGREEERGRLRIMMASIAGVLLSVGALLLCFFSATERYMVEFVPPLMLFALLGGLCAERMAGAAPWRVGVRAWFALAGGATLMAGVLISFDYHGRIMARTDPEAWEKITETVGRIYRHWGWRPLEAGARHLPEWVETPEAGSVRTLPRADPRAGRDDILIEKDVVGRLRLGIARFRDVVQWGDWSHLGAGERLVLPVAPGAKPGGILVMRLCLPDLPAGMAEPLLVLGRTNAADVLALRHVGGERWQLIFDHWAHPLREGPIVALNRGGWHEFRISVPSCRFDAFGRETAGEVVVCVNGGEMLRVTSSLYAFGRNEVDMGRNKIGATTCRPNYSGWILQTEWSRE